MSALIDRTGTRIDIAIRLGVDTGILDFTATNEETGDPVSLVGYSYEGGVYHRSDRENVLTWNYDETSAADGIIRFYLTHEQNSGLVTADDEQQSPYVYWLNIITTSGEIVPLIYGDYLVIWGTGE